MAESEMYVDAKRLREFAEQLNSTVAHYKKSLDTLQAKLSRLSATWRDQEFTAFVREVATTRRILEEFIRDASEARRRILDDADRVEAYQRVRLG